MATLTPDDLRTPADIAAALELLRIRLPLQLCDDAGVVLDADGNDVLVVDDTGLRQDEEATALAAVVAAAINAAALTHHIEQQLETTNSTVSP
ncbi:hypothetical protein SAMN02745172_02499 [Pseudoxanthobacter soli DSM 19599]|uniref:Uncharacterized protein n=1 Tax=Pseudoxanthobacter soli DSM 19599 TaxID=1123029 RepID=A0A1M7ZM14_9HYPH|nr:hypothetical protein [Pseudoxanthobacter soli]SHO65852.1 hypothetical protein SAMN02745172_02499 [Pseudoxanthobacter soli DSM 19599]